MTGLDLREVDSAFGEIQLASGPGSTRGKADILGRLLGRATRDEQDFVIRLIAGDLRQGALEGVLVDAVARAADIPAARVRRAAMLAGALAPVARVALARRRRGALAVPASAVSATPADARRFGGRC